MDNKETARKLMEIGWNQGNNKVFEDAFATDAKYHDPTMPNAPLGAAALIEQTRLYRTAFPDLKMTVDQLMADGDYVVMRWTCRGTHTGPLLGAAPTQRKVTVTGMIINRFTGGKIVETWGNWDAAGLMQQIGVMPPMGAGAGSSATRGAGVHK